MSFIAGWGVTGGIVQIDRTAFQPSFAARARPESESSAARGTLSVEVSSSSVHGEAVLTEPADAERVIRLVEQRLAIGTSPLDH